MTRDELSVVFFCLVYIIERVHSAGECASAPCQNGGTCSEGGGAFQCACAFGYCGTTCSDPVFDGCKTGMYQIAFTGNNVNFARISPAILRGFPANGGILGAPFGASSGGVVTQCIRLKPSTSVLYTLNSGATHAVATACAQGTAAGCLFQIGRDFQLSNDYGRSLKIVPCGTCNFAPLSFDWHPFTGELFATVARTGNRLLVKIDETTGASTSVGITTGLSGFVFITFDGFGNLWTSASSQLYTVNHLTGAPTLVGTLNPDGLCPTSVYSRFNMAWDNTTGIMTVQATCNSNGFRLLGSFTDMFNATWTHSIVDLGALGTPSQSLTTIQNDTTACTGHGICSNVPQTNGNYTCACDFGWSGPICNTTDFACVSQPCQNGAVCSTVDGTAYSCDCPAGFTGRQCETNINECASAPCLNGGTCADGISQFTCTCPCNFGDPLCSTSASFICASASNATCPVVNTTSPFTLPAWVTSWTAISNIGDTVIHGSMALDPGSSISGFPPGTFTGVQEVANAQAQLIHSQFVVVYLFAKNSVPTTTGLSDLAGMTLPPGVYSASSALGISTAVTLDGGNDPSSTWIFQVGTSLTTAADVLLINGALAVHVLWQVSLDTTIGAGNTIEGSILSGQDATLVSGATVNGRIGAGLEVAGSLVFGSNIVYADLLTPGSAVNSSCVVVVCENGGTCTNTNETCMIACECPFGYEGTRCQITIDPCTSQPCRNGATCVPGSGSYGCTCAAGYSGTFCSTEINECSSSPCLNGGTCADGLNSFNCTCAAGYSGTFCSTNINECSSSPCKNGGTCVDGVNSFFCDCTPDRIGAYCETDFAECTSGPCQNGGTCVDGTGSWVCVCLSGFSGNQCQTDVNECSSSPCESGGTCVDGVNSFACTCAAGYSGTFCGTDVDECSSFPCRNEGTCVDGVNSFSCQCRGGFVGALCETEANECSSVPCLNGATCVDGVDSFSCQCLAGFSGTYCQTEIDECASSPCLNGGTCVDRVDSFHCNCTARFNGTLCQQEEQPTDEPGAPVVSTAGIVAMSVVGGLFVLFGAVGLYFACASSAPASAGALAATFGVHRPLLSSGRR